MEDLQYVHFPKLRLDRCILLRCLGCRWARRRLTFSVSLRLVISALWVNIITAGEKEKKLISRKARRSSSRNISWSPCSPGKKQLIVQSLVCFFFFPLSASAADSGNMMDASLKHPPTGGLRKSLSNIQMFPSLMTCHPDLIKEKEKEKKKTKKKVPKIVLFSTGKNITKKKKESLPLVSYQTCFPQFPNPDNKK